ncbi:oligosaccharide flippase family protein [Paenibacillus rhizovicinus]|uniref:Oligosaccharide flippase family protein n=1 Tax=Paenibacillus rhizovicinus TaxID=2704463 RepID=A0A6C0NXB9_9BACL|nr:oligosaccharide flippase family protein [Paenibacillus rhizovicinus]QHW30857.1 oligosaccharide flippase family protein [Paenibacillus rhizovicinus]
MKAIKNYLYNLIYQILTILLPIVTIPYVSRTLGPDGLGSFALSNTYAQYFVLFGMIGLSIYSSREIAYVRDDESKLSKAFWEINFIRVITVGIAFILYMVLFGLILNSSNKIVYIMQSLVILSSLVDISWLFIGLEDFKRVIMKNIFVKLVGMVLIFCFVKHSSDVWLYALILGITQLVGQAIMWFEIPKSIIFIFPNTRNTVRHLKESIKMFLPQIAINIYTMLDKVILGAITNTAQVGLYDNSQRIIKLIITIVTTVATVTMPKMANFHKNKQYEEFQNYIYKSFSFVSFLAFPMTFGLIGVCKSFVPWFYGPGFEGIIPMFYIGSFLMITLGWSSILGIQVLLSIKREKQFTIAVSYGAAINIILNLILIKKFEGVGTTVSCVVAEFTGMFIMLFYLRDIINFRKLFKPVGKYFISSLVMCFPIWELSSYFNSTALNSFIIVLIGAILYLTMMIITRDAILIYALKLLKSRMRKSREAYGKQIDM